MIVNALNAAKQSILVQAYSFTSAPIAKALVDAERRGVSVKVILDKSQRGKRYTISRFLQNQGIPVWIDYKPAIAHNKVMIIDQSILITGIFNFTKAAQQKNTENLLIIENKDLAKIYILNWLKRMVLSDKIQ